MGYLDTRDLEEIAAEIEGRIADLEDDDLTDEERADLEPVTDEERAHLEELRNLEDEIVDWSYGATLIPVDDFEDYARELAEDIGAVPSDAGWPAYCIDWEQAARDLATDYTIVTYRGEDYYVR